MNRNLLLVFLSVGAVAIVYGVMRKDLLDIGLGVVVVVIAALGYIFWRRRPS